MKKRKIKRLDIVFENCEVYSLEPTMIELCIIDNVTKNIGINCFQYTQGEVYDSLMCEELMLAINKQGLNAKSNFDMEETPLKERLRWCDITHIDIIYNDETNDYITVPWKDDGDNEFKNCLQHNISYRPFFDNDKCKYIAVIISKKKYTKKELEKVYGIN